MKTEMVKSCFCILMSFSCHTRSLSLSLSLCEEFCCQRSGRDLSQVGKASIRILHTQLLNIAFIARNALMELVLGCLYYGGTRNFFR